MIVAGEKDEQDETPKHDGFLDIGRDVVETIEVGVARIGFGDTVDGAAGSDAIALHARDDAELGPRGAGEHDDGDDDAQRGSTHAEGAEEIAEAEDDDDGGAGNEAFMMQNADTFGDDGAGGVGIGDAAESGPCGDGKKKSPPSQKTSASQAMVRRRVFMARPAYRHR